MDRVDYTKGIPERFAAVDRLLQQHPELKGTFSFVQIGAPSRVHIPAYRQLNEDLRCPSGRDQLAARARNLAADHLSQRTSRARASSTLYRMAAGCVVSSLHDGMNLVAKEFVASPDDRQGVLVLSQFTGAARELADALLVNPYAVDEFAEGLYTALTMPPDEQQQRMGRMRQQIDDNNIYRWAGMLLSEASKLIHVQQSVGELV